MKRGIPFNKPAIVGREIEYMRNAIAAGQISGDGIFTAKAQVLLRDLVGARAALLTTSCTHALELAALLLDIAPGDEVIVPSFTFVSTVNAFVLRGARPIFVDCRPDTLNLDEKLLEQAITPRTKAILVMHYAGVACEMDSIMEIAARRRVPVVEDNAHGLFATYRGRQLGTFGTFAAQSFHETKNFSCGEGGALLINDASYLERAEIIRQKGTDRSRLLRGQVDKYTWVDIGSSYSLSDMLAAFLFAQLEEREKVQKTRQTIWERYDAELRDWAKEHGVHLPFVPAECEQPYHIYYLLLPTAEIRDQLIAHLRAHSILAVFHYLPLHVSRMGMQFGGRPGDCPVAESAAARLLRLPLFHDLSSAEQAEIISAVIAFSEQPDHRCLEKWR